MDAATPCLPDTATPRWTPWLCARCWPPAARGPAQVLPQLRAQAAMVIAATRLGHFPDGRHGINAPGAVEREVVVGEAIPDGPALRSMLLPFHSVGQERRRVPVAQTTAGFWTPASAASPAM